MDDLEVSMQSPVHYKELGSIQWPSILMTCNNWTVNDPNLQVGDMAMPMNARDRVQGVPVKFLQMFDALSVLSPELTSIYCRRERITTALYTFRFVDTAILVPG